MTPDARQSNIHEPINTERERDRYRAALQRISNHIEGADALGPARVEFIRGVIRAALATEAEHVNGRGDRPTVMGVG